MPAGTVPGSEPAFELLSGGRYRVSETVLRRDSPSDFDDGCKDFAELRALILQARASAAMDDANAVPGATPASRHRVGRIRYGVKATAAATEKVEHENRQGQNGFAIHLIEFR
jgi:hypothetical protein